MVDALGEADDLGSVTHLCSVGQCPLDQHNAGDPAVLLNCSPHRNAAIKGNLGIRTSFVIKGSLPQGTLFPRCGKLIKLLHVFTSTPRTPNFTHVHLVDLLSCLLGHSLSRPSVDGGTPLGVTEILKTDDLKFPILLGKSEDSDGTEGNFFPLGGGEHACSLCRGYMLLFGTT